MLKDILLDLAATYGVDLANPSERSLLVARVNKAARELHDKKDIPESLDEIVVDINQSSQQVALPNFVYSVRGMRYYDGRDKIEIEDKKNRYHQGYGDGLYDLKFRQLKDSPLCREIANFSTLTLEIPLGETEEFTVTIAGNTEHSTRDSETLTFAPGDLSKETTLNFKEVESISKSKVTKYDITIYDADDYIVSVIPNILKDVNYKIFQITDSDISGGTSYSAVEVLYVIHFRPAKDDGDTFWGTDKYDRAVAYKYRELYGEDDLQIAGAFQVKATQDLTEMQGADKPGKKERLSIKPSPFFDMPYARRGPFRTVY